MRYAPPFRPRCREAYGASRFYRGCRSRSYPLARASLDAQSRWLLHLLEYFFPNRLSLEANRKGKLPSRAQVLQAKAAESVRICPTHEHMQSYMKDTSPEREGKRRGHQIPLQA